MEIVTIGYGGRKPHEFFEELDQLGAGLVVDVRRDPFHAFLGVYTKPILERRVNNYVWIRELGNQRRTLPPVLVDEKVGLLRLLDLIRTRQAKRVVLLCAEKDEERCHRAYVKRLVEEKLRSELWARRVKT